MKMVVGVGSVFYCWMLCGVLCERVWNVFLCLRVLCVRVGDGVLCVVKWFVGVGCV